MKYESKITILVAMGDYLHTVTERKDSCKKLYKLNNNQEMLKIALYWNCEEVKTKTAIKEFRELTKECTS